MAAEDVVVVDVVAVTSNGAADAHFEHLLRKLFLFFNDIIYTHKVRGITSTTTTRTTTTKTLLGSSFFKK